VRRLGVKNQRNRERKAYKGKNLMGKVEHHPVLKYIKAALNKEKISTKKKNQAPSKQSVRKR